MDTTTKFFLPGAIVLAGLLIGGAVLWSSNNPAPGGGTGETVSVKDISFEGVPTIGDANAPVTLLDWSDYQCPFCARYETETLPQIVTNYVETGKVRIVFMDFAFLGPDSLTAGEYGRAVWKLYPEKYAQWRAAMYEAQDNENGGFGNAKSIDELNATIAGLDVQKISADVKANGSAYRTLMEKDRQEARKAGISATPSFLIGSTLIQGAYPYSEFERAIETELSR